MSPETNELYDFGDFRLDRAERVLSRDGKFIPVTPKVFDTLLVLIESAGRTVEKDELMQKIWQDRFVEESNLTFNIKMLRKALGDEAANPRYVETVPRRGYRFIAAVKTPAADIGKEDGNHIYQANGDAAGVKLNQIDFGIKSPDEAQPVKIRNRRSSPSVFYSLLALIVTGAFVAAGFFLWRQPPTFYERFGSQANFLTVERLTDTGNIHGANISPDGKLLVYNSTDSGQNSISLRQIATGKTIRLVETSDELFHGLGFSRDGEYIYFSHHRKGEHLTLSRISTLGGAPVKILTNVHSGWSFSPDEKQIAFGRIDEQGSALIITDIDGSNEQRVLSMPKSRYMFAVNWSPDGKTIAYCTGNGRYDGGGLDYDIFEFNLADKTENRLTDFKWNSIDRIKWLPDRSGLLVTARRKAEDPEQIWRLRLPDGHAEPITKDASALEFSGASADFSRILATQTALKTAVWNVSTTDLADARQIGKGEFDVEWTTDGKIIFPSRETINTDIWLTNSAGGDKRQLTPNNSLERSPATSPDGKFFVYVSTQNERQNVWRMNADGTNQMALTSGEGENFPTVTPDSKWVVYTSNKDKSLWRVPIQSGAAEQISAARHQRVAISPDGTRLAHFGRDANKKSKLIIETFPECQPVQDFDAVINEASMMKIVWARDGKSLVYYVNDISLVGNLWRQSLDGGAPNKLTNFTAERIFDFAFSPDESRMAIVRGTWNHDAVLLKGFK